MYSQPHLIFLARCSAIKDTGSKTVAKSTSFAPAFYSLLILENSIEQKKKKDIPLDSALTFKDIFDSEWFCWGLPGSR